VDLQQIRFDNVDWIELALVCVSW